MTLPIQVAPSILSADFGKLAAEIQEVEAAGADVLHVDVMDGRFVPNITIGPLVVKAARRATKLPLDVHLMIVEPERYIADFASAGADTIGVQIEAVIHAQRTLTEIRKLGKRSCIVLNPHTPEDSIRYLLDDLDQILVMSVNPGFGGQSFLPLVLPKLERLRAMIDESGRDITLAVDGGIDVTTAPRVVAAGARLLIAGAAVFGKTDRRVAIHDLRKAAAGEVSK